MDNYFVSVSFMNNMKNYYFSTNDSSLKVGTFVVVETVRGIEVANVVAEPKEIKELTLDYELKPIIRIASSDDLNKCASNADDAVVAFKQAKEIISKLDLDMRLLLAEYTLDKTKLIFTYSSEERVDFRELLKELASKFRCRIELRQIGPRDRSKMVGGLGPCGLALCCNKCLNDFDGISINMAKNQFLALNISKLSGQCGKLICCLKYEDEAYNEIRANLPKVGVRLTYDDQQYKLTSINILTNQCRLENADGSINVSLNEVKKILGIENGNKK